MAGMGPAPKPDAQRRRRNSPTFDWTVLPSEGRSDPPPPLPLWKSWSEATTVAWAEWWATPQATAWDQSGRSLWRWLLLFERMVTEPDAPVTVHAQLQGIEDRHGFTPAAMLKLRWRIVEDELAVQREQPRPSKARSAKAQTASLASRLRAVPTAPVEEPAVPAGPKVKKPAARKRAPSKKKPPAVD